MSADSPALVSELRIMSIKLVEDVHQQLEINIWKQAEQNARQTVIENSHVMDMRLTTN